MIPFRVIRSGVLLTGLLVALGAALPAAAAGGFSAGLSPEQKTAAGLTSLTTAELAVLDRLVAVDTRLGRTQAPGLTDPSTQRYSEVESREAGLDRLTPVQLAKLDELITAALAAAPQPASPLQPRERPRLRDDAILSEKGRLQVHGGLSLTFGTAGGGRNFRETGAWISYFDPVTGLGLSISYSRYTGDGFPNYSPYYTDAPYVYSAPRPLAGMPDPAQVDQSEFGGNGASLRNPGLVKSAGPGFRR